MATGKGNSAPDRMLRKMEPGIAKVWRLGAGCLC